MTENKSKPASLEELIAFRERVRVELLGQEDPEYRQEVENLLKATDEKIKEVSKVRTKK